MGYREVTMVEVKEVIRLWLRGRKIRRIAVRTGMARNTVRSYVAAAQACGLEQADGEGALTDERLASVLIKLKGRKSRGRGKSWTVCAEHRAFVKDKLDGGVVLTKVRKLLRRRGVEVPYSTLHRFAGEELGFGRGGPTIPVADCEPGEELQVDTGWMGQLEPDLFGKRRRFRAWIFTAVRSRHRFVYPCFSESTETAIEACEAAWSFYGGVFRVLLPDNTKAIVQTADPLEPVFNRAFQEYAQSRGFEIDPARVRKPKDKGRVERAVQSTRADCFGGEVLQALEDARALALHWCRHEHGMTRHGRTHRMPLEHFEAEEKARLQPAPTTPYEVPLWCEPKVQRDQHVQVARALYSLPEHFGGVRLIGRKVLARADRTVVRLYLDAVLIKVFPRQPAGGRYSDPADFPQDKAAYANRDVEFLRQQAHKHGEAVGRYAAALLDTALPWTRMRRVYALLGLCKRYGSERVEQVCRIALQSEMLEIRRLTRMLELATPAAEADSETAAAVIPLARYLRPASDYAVPRASTPHPRGGDDDQ